MNGHGNVLMITVRAVRMAMLMVLAVGNNVCLLAGVFPMSDCVPAWSLACVCCACVACLWSLVDNCKNYAGALAGLLACICCVLVVMWSVIKKDP